MESGDQPQGKILAWGAVYRGFDESWSNHTYRPRNGNGCIYGLEPELWNKAKVFDPFSLLSYNAPHWPLHAHPEDIAKYEGVYDAG